MSNNVCIKQLIQQAASCISSRAQMSALHIYLLISDGVIESGDKKVVSEKVLCII